MFLYFAWLHTNFPRNQIDQNIHLKDTDSRIMTLFFVWSFGKIWGLHVWIFFVNASSLAFRAFLKYVEIIFSTFFYSSHKFLIILDTLVRQILKSLLIFPNTWLKSKIVPKIWIPPWTTTVNWVQKLTFRVGKMVWNSTCRFDMEKVSTSKCC